MAHSRARRPYAALVAVLATTLALTGVGISSAGTATAKGKAKPPTLSASGSAIEAGRAVALRGVAAPAGRTVTLQKVSGGKWVTVGSKKSGGGGAYSFGVTTTSVATSYKVVAAKKGRTKAAASKAISVVGFVRPAPEAQTFFDDFNSFDKTKWATRAPGYYHGSRQCAAPSDSMVSARGGVLTLSVRRTSSTVARNADGTSYRCDGKGGRPKFVYQNAMIGTAEGNGNQFRQAYGTFAAQMKMQDPTGMHGAFWLQGNDASSTEIDVIEHFGTKSKDGLTTKLHQTVGGRLQTVTKGGLTNVLKAQGRKATDWNVYSVDWTPSLYIFRINGRETYRTNRLLTGSQQEIVLSLLTSDWARSSLKSSSGSLQVDWVRAWAY